MKPLVKGQQGQPATTWLTQAEYDAACRIATQRGVSLSRVLRVAFMRMVQDERGAILQNSSSS
jgi:hypothetical protein